MKEVERNWRVRRLLGKGWKVMVDKIEHLKNGKVKNTSEKEYFGKGTSEYKWEGIEPKTWDWENFESTGDFPVSPNLLDWVIGQDKALNECYLCLDEWVHKLKYLEHANWWGNFKDPNAPKPSSKVPPGPYLLLLGDPGTGKSLIGKALAERLTSIYKRENIQLFDILSWENKTLPGQPRISISPAGKGPDVIRVERVKELKKSFISKAGFKLIQGFLIGLGLFVLAIALYFTISVIQAWAASPALQVYYAGDFMKYFFSNFAGLTPLFLAGGSAIFFGVFIGWFGKLAGSSNMQGIGGASTSKTPKLIVDNSKKEAPFIDATGHKSSQLFGDIAWDPYQTGGLGTPEHQRVTAGDVHRACMGVLYIDEVKNLHPAEAITLLTVLEDGQLPITLRSMWSEGGSAAMNVSTDPVPSMTFLLAAGNFDSIGMIHAALMDRIYGYGKVVRMNNDMPNTIENRRKYVQFISQEIKRFNLIPFTRDACIELVDEGRRRSNKRHSLTTKFRPLISIIKTSAILAMNDKSEVVEAKHVKEAIEVHCKTIQKQILEHYMEEEGKFLDISPTGFKLGQIYGMAVSQDPYSGEMAGAVTALRGSLVNKSKLTRKKKDLQGSYCVTGVAKEKEEKYIGDSIAKVRSVILQKYGVDIAQDYMTHIDFSQSYGVDGPSAGVTMTLLLCSLIEGKPIRQDTAVTGEINVGVGDEIKITAVGGLYEKIKAAEKWGFKRVIIPKKNYEQSIDPRDYTIEVIPGDTLDDYLKEILVDQK